MTDDTNPFAQQTFQSEPMFTEASPQQPPPNEAAPVRKSRRSKRTAAAASPASSSEKPKRKYTLRRTGATHAAALQVASAAPAPKALLSPELADTETVVRVTAKIIDELRLLSPAIRKQVWTGIGRLL